jgi:large subunit ribosomal protein L21
MSAHAVVRIRDLQFRVSPNQVLRVPRIQADAGSTVTFDEVLMLSGDGTKIGTPLVAGASVSAEVLSHGRGEKVIAFRYKRRKGHRKTVGSRPSFTALRITRIEG